MFALAVPVAWIASMATADECGGQNIVDLVVLSYSQTMDSDQDLIPDAYDNCLNVINQIQLDFDEDGFGNACDFDISNNGVVDLPDMTFVMSVLGTPNQAADFNNNGVVGLPDLIALMGQIGTTPGPSGLSCAGEIPCTGGQ